jgi:hypothetical protein
MYLDRSLPHYFAYFYSLFNIFLQNLIIRFNDFEIAKTIFQYCP